MGKTERNLANYEAKNNDNYTNTTGIGTAWSNLVNHIGLAGLLFGNADRFLTDLIMNLELRAALIDMKAVIDGQGKAVVCAVC